MLSGVILAAGSSTRMGQPKQLLPLAGKPLLLHAIDAAATSCLDEVIVVLGAHAEKIESALRLPPGGKVRIVVNDQYEDGQSTSLRLGLRSASADSRASAVLLGDQPFVTAELIDKVAAAFEAGDAPITRPVYVAANGDVVPGHPVFIARRIWPDVERLKGDEGARALLAAHPDWLQEVRMAGAPATDIDTQADYQRALNAPAKPRAAQAEPRAAQEMPRAAQEMQAADGD